MLWQSRKRIFANLDGQWKMCPDTNHMTFTVKKSGGELRVEVKGTTSAGDEVILTPKEVVHARGEFPNVALIVVANITLANGNKPGGGDLRFIAPWKIEDASLEPLGFSHQVPPGKLTIA